MNVINKTKKITIAEKIIIPTSLMDQSLGLLKYKTPKSMLFKTRFGIHTFGMSYPIDVLILDKKNRVAAMKKNLLPNRIFLWNPEWNTVIELPVNTIKKTRTEPDDTLEII